MIRIIIKNYYSLKKDVSRKFQIAFIMAKMDMPMTNRFFTKQHVRALAKRAGFEILDIKEVYEEPVTLYLVSTRKL